MCDVDAIVCNTWINYDFIEDGELIKDYHDRFMLLHGGYEE